VGKPGFLAEMGQRFAGTGSVAGPSTALARKAAPNFAQDDRLGVGQDKVCCGVEFGVPYSCPKCEDMNEHKRAQRFERMSLERFSC